MLHGRDLPLLSLPLTFFCSFLQESDGAAVISALRFHPVTHRFSLLCVCKPYSAGCVVYDTDPFMCVDVHAYLCMGMFIPLYKPHL